MYNPQLEYRLATRMSIPVVRAARFKIALFTVTTTPTREKGPIQPQFQNHNNKKFSRRHQLASK